MYIPLLLIAGLALLWLGLRGRRLDDHPICARCGFDLIGTLHTFADRATDTPRVCPECAAEIYRPRAIRHGARRRRTDLIVAGGLLAAISSGILATIIWLNSAGLNSRALQPFWMIRRAALTDGPSAIEAQRELIRRISDNKLAAASVQKLITDALVRQPDIAKPWQLWGDIFAAADVAGSVSPTQRQAFFDNRVQARARPKARVTSGAPLRFDLTTWSRGSSGASPNLANVNASIGALRVEFVDISIDGRALPKPAPWIYQTSLDRSPQPYQTYQVSPGRGIVPLSEVTLGWAPAVIEGSSPRGSPYPIAPDQPGTYSLRATLRLTPGSGLLYPSPSGPWFLGQPPLQSMDVTLNVPVEIVPASSPDLRAIPDDAQLDRFAGGLRAELGFFAPTFRYEGNPPSDQRHLAFDIFLERADPRPLTPDWTGNWTFVGCLIAIRGEWSEPEHNLQISPDLMTRARIQGTARLRLRPSFDLAKRWFTAGEVTVGKDIVVEAQVR